MSPAGNPDDGTTRYLCAAVHRFGPFGDSAIAEFLVEEVRSVPPSPGLDSAAVLRDAVAARYRRRVRDIVLLGLLALLAVVNPLGVLLWAIVAAPVARRRPRTGGGFTDRIVAVLRPIGAVLVVVALCTVKAVTGIGFPSGGAWWPVVLVLAVLAFAVLGADEYVVHRLVRECFRPGRFVADHRQSPDERERRLRGLGHDRYRDQLTRIAEADEYSARATAHADVIVHRGPSPFIGAGLALETVRIPLSLEPADDPSRSGPPAPIRIADLHDAVAAAMAQLTGQRSLLPSMRLDGVVRREQVFMPAKSLLQNITTSLGAAALKAKDQPPARHVALRAARSLAAAPFGWARYYSCFRVESQDRDLASTCYLYAGAGPDVLYIELTHCILPPIDEVLREIDLVVPIGGGPLGTAARGLVALPATTWPRVRSLTRRLSPRTRRTRGWDPDSYGASHSLREHVSGNSKPPDHFLKSDAAQFVKIVDRTVFRAIAKYLEALGYDVVEFQKEARTAIQQNSVHITGGTFTSSTISAGNNNVHTVGPADATT